MYADYNSEVERIRAKNARLQAQLSSQVDSSDQELEAEVSRLKELAETFYREHLALKTEAKLQAEQLQFKDEQLQLLSSAPTIDQEQLSRVRSRVLKTWRVAKAAENKERIAEALDRFIEALKSTPASIPGEEQ